jgi:hypothetical protein
MTQLTRPFSRKLSGALLLAVLILVSNTLLAATASVSRNKLAKEEVFQLKIVAEENLDRDDIDFSPLEQDFFTGTPHFGFYSNSINGNKSVRSEWTIALAPLRAGIITIPAFKVGNSRTEPIQLTVSVDPSATTQDDLVEVRIKLDKDEFYLGELNRLQTRVIVKADSRQIRSANISAPSVQGTDNQAFSLEQLGEEKQYQTVIDGVSVIVVDKEYKVSAKQTGKFVLNGPSFKGAILDGRRRSSARIVPVDTKPEILVVSVLDKPADYTGNWLPSSALTLNQTWYDENGAEITNPENVELNAGSPITREITLSAKGIDSAMLPNLNISYPDAIRMYQETPQLSQQGDTAQMVLKQVLIGKQGGTVTLPSINLNWFNSREKQPEQATLNGLTLHITPSDSPVAEPLPAAQPLQTQTEAVTETVTVNDPGFWPYLTALFALAWLASTVLWLRARKTAPQANSTEPKDIVIADNRSLIRAVKARDGVKTQSLLRTWLAQSPSLTETQILQITTEVQKMQASLYAPQARNWSDKVLIRLLKQAGRSKVKNEPQQVLEAL